MIQIKFRESRPARNYQGQKLSDYKDYKIFLVKDFNERCGYTNSSHFWFGGQINFQIDHFKPKSKFPDLETEYSNLVYSCSHVNRAKSNDLSTYLDPCLIDYNEHFYRDNFGNIYPNEDSDTAKYMYLKLKLYLKRYGIIWMLEQLHSKMNKLKVLFEATGNQEAKDLLAELALKFLDYLKFLHAVQ